MIVAGLEAVPAADDRARAAAADRGIGDVEARLAEAIRRAAEEAGEALKINSRALVRRSSSGFAPRWMAGSDC